MYLYCTMSKVMRKSLLCFGCLIERRRCFSRLCFVRRQLVGKLVIDINIVAVLERVPTGVVLLPRSPSEISECCSSFYRQVCKLYSSFRQRTNDKFCRLCLLRMRDIGIFLQAFVLLNHSIFVGRSCCLSSLGCHG